LIDPNSTLHAFSIEDAIDAVMDSVTDAAMDAAAETGSEIARPSRAHAQFGLADIPLPARIADECSGRLASSRSWLDRYRKASTARF